MCAWPGSQTSSVPPGSHASPLLDSDSDPDSRQRLPMESTGSVWGRDASGHTPGFGVLPIRCVCVSAGTTGAGRVIRSRGTPHPGPGDQNRGLAAGQGQIRSVTRPGSSDHCPTALISRRVSRAGPRRGPRALIRMYNLLRLQLLSQPSEAGGHPWVTGDGQRPRGESDLW